MLILENNKFLLPLKLPSDEQTIGFYNHIIKTISYKYNQFGIGVEEFKYIEKGLDKKYTIRKFFNKYYVYLIHNTGHTKYINITNVNH